MTETATPPASVPATSTPVVVSAPEMMASARLVRALQHQLEWLVAAIVIGSVAAIGSVHPPAYTALWVACFAAFGLTLLRALAIGALRERLGEHRVAFHVSGRWLVVEPAPDAAVVFSIDLRAPALPRAPLFLPGLAFLVLALVQLLPLLGGPASIAPEATRRGITFVLAFVLLHESAAAAFAHRPARRRFRRLLSWLGAALALVALVQLASGTKLIYGVFEPLEGGQIFGPFVNRNHFAGYMLLVVPIALGLLAEAWGRYASRAGEKANTRRRLVALSTGEGTSFVYAALPPLLGIGALLATTSRGGLLAFAGALVIGLVGARSRRGTPGWAAALVFLAMTLAWFGLERLEVRFARTSDDAPGRTIVWQEAILSLHGARWLTGFGFDTFAEGVSRVPAWTLPVGATPWPEWAQATLRSGARVGYRSPGGISGITWYREAHNDWLQLLYEAGVPGLLIGVWAALAVLAAARRDPWLFAALAGVLMHVLVDFDLQIPAVTTLFVVLAALPQRR
ncbi:MAG TPA: O-antigen ligase family protein [Ideonella sp.]|nr:O-antigen ligase family protein [Ideonella sp.]